MVLAKASRLGVRCRRLGTAAAGRHAACRVESCTGTGSGTAERTGCCPCYGSHSLQRMCWWPLFWPVRVKKQEKGKEWNDYKNNFTGKTAFPKWRVLNELTMMGFPWNVFTSSLKYLYACGETETRINKSVHDAAFQAECQEKCSRLVVVTCWASVSDWNVMYQLLLCANSTLITFGQLSFLNSDSTSCEWHWKDCLTSDKHQIQSKGLVAFTDKCTQKLPLPQQVWFQGPPSGW